MRTSPGSSVPPTWHRTFGFSGVAPTVTGGRSFSTSTRHRSSAAARQSPGGFVVSIRTYSASRVTGSIVELCPPPRGEFNQPQEQGRSWDEKVSAATGAAAPHKTGKDL